MSDATKTTTRNFVTLDGLRGVAALAIAVRHAPFLWERGYPLTVLSESYLAVDFFFVLSGFVLAHAYGPRLSEGMGFRQFITVRLIRFSPLYWLSALLGFAAAAGGFLALGLSGAWLQALLRNLVFALLWLPTAFYPAALFPLNSPAWSLLQELIANALLVWTRTSLKRCIPLVAAAAVGLAVAVGFGWFGFGAASGAMDAGSGWASFPAGLLRALYSFFAGSVTYRLWQSGKPRPPLPPLLPAALLCAILILPAPAAFPAAYDLLVTLLGFPLLVYLAAGTAPARRLAALFAWLGRVSYGVYVLQMPLYVGISYFAGWRAGGDRFIHSDFHAGLAVLALLVLATLLDRYYVVPFRRFLTRAGS